MTRIRRVAVAIAAVALTGAAAGCGGDDGDTAKPAVVTIKTFQFTPKRLTIDAGTTVTFENTDAIHHTVTSGVRKGENDNTPDGRFDLKLADAGAKASHTFANPGVYPYYCVIHPGQGMTGEVVVKET